MRKTEKRKQNICDAVNMLYSAKDRGLLAGDGSPSDEFVESFVDICERRFKDGFIVSKEALKQYEKSRAKRNSFFSLDTEDSIDRSNIEEFVDTQLSYRGAQTLNEKARLEWIGGVTGSNGKVDLNKKARSFCSAYDGMEWKDIPEDKKAQKSTETSVPKTFDVARNTSSCNFGKLIYKFVSNKKTIL